MAEKNTQKRLFVKIMIFVNNNFCKNEIKNMKQKNIYVFIFVNYLN